MINPLRSKPEHQVALLVSIVVGAVGGLIFGYTLFSLRWPDRLTYWLSHQGSEAIAWAAAGSVVVGGCVYVWRNFSN